MVDRRRQTKRGDCRFLIGERAQQFHRKTKNSQTDLGIRTLVRHVEKGRIRRIFDEGFQENETSLAVVGQSYYKMQAVNGRR